MCHFWSAIFKKAKSTFLLSRQFLDIQHQIQICFDNSPEIKRKAKLIILLNCLGWWDGNLLVKPQFYGKLYIVYSAVHKIRYSLQFCINQRHMIFDIFYIFFIFTSFRCLTAFALNLWWLLCELLTLIAYKLLPSSDSYYY